MTTEIPEESQFLSTALGRISEQLSKSPWIRLTPRKLWPESMGAHLTSVLYSRKVVPDVSEGAWWGMPEEQRIEYATTIRTYQLEQSACVSPTFRLGQGCDWYEAAQITAINLQWIQENWIRDKYMLNCGNKVVLNEPSLHKCQSSGSGSDQPNVVPKYRLLRGFLDAAYMDLLRDAAEGDYGNTDGQPHFVLMASPEAINSFKRDNSDVRRDLRFSSTSSDQLKELGAGWAYFGFVPVADIQAPRYKRAGWPWKRSWVRVPYYLATDGSALVNPEYVDSSFEMAFIYNPNVQTVRVPNNIDGSEGMYGNVTLIDDRDEHGNPTGAKKIYTLCTQGAEPVRTEWGYSFLFRRLSKTEAAKRWLKRTWKALTSRL